jgi:hypothetical protein
MGVSFTIIERVNMNNILPNSEHKASFYNSSNGGCAVTSRAKETNSCYSTSIIVCNVNGSENKQGKLVVRAI